MLQSVDFNDVKLKLPHVIPHSLGAFPDHKIQQLPFDPLGSAVRITGYSCYSVENPFQMPSCFGRVIVGRDPEVLDTVFLRNSNGHDCLSARLCIA
jgi:hypothetical protein